MASTDPPPAPTVSLAYTSALDAPAQVFWFIANAAITQPALSNFPTGGLTLSCWLNTSDTTAGSVLLSYDANPASNPHRLWIKSPANLEIGIGTQSTGPTGVSLADGVWHHLAVTLASSDATHFAVGIYKDGVQSWFALATLAGAAGLETGGDLVLGQGVAGEPGFTGQMSEFRLLKVVQSPAVIMTDMQIRLSPQAPSAVIVWALTSAQTAGQLSGNYKFDLSSPPLQYRIDRSLIATFTQSAPNATYDLQWSASDNTYYPLLTGLPLAPVSLSDFQINTAYTAILRAVLNGQTGPWSQPATALTLDLGQAVLALGQPMPAQVQLSWQAIDQALLYQLNFYRNGSATPSPPSGSQTSTNFDLSTLVNGSDTWQYNVAATAAGAVAPLTPIMPVSAPTLQFTYDWAVSSGVLRASWTTDDGAVDRYLIIELVSGGVGTLVAAPLLPAATSAYVVNTTLSEGQTYTAKLRALQTGTIGAWTPTAQVVIHQLLGPVVGVLSADGTAHTITVPWTASQGPANQSFVAELWTAEGNAPLMTISPATSPQVFSNLAIVDGVSFKVRVRATADGSYGKWSEWKSITVGGLPQVTGVAARADAFGNVVVSWTPITGFDNVTYVATITGTGVSYSSPAVSANNVTLQQADTHVQNGQTYTVTVQASAPGRPSGPTSDPISVTIQISPNPPPPQPKVSDPINAATGAYLYQNDELIVGAVVPLVFSTYYSSRVPTPTENPIYTGKPLGNRWNHSYNTRLARDPNGQTIYVFWGHLGIDAFTIPASVTGFYPASGSSPGSSLFLDATLIFTLKLADQSRYRFDFAGKLLSVTDRFGRRTDYAYDGSQLTTVTDAATNKKLTFNYTGDYLQQVTDDTGRHVAFTYDGADLKTVTDVMNRPRVFNYVGESLIETIVDQRNNTAVKNTYTNGQVTKQQDARALATGQSYGTTLSYQSSTIGGVPMVLTSVTDRANHAITYESLAANGAQMSKRYDLGSDNIQVESYTYDAFNNILSETLYLGPASTYTPGAGNLTTYTYDGDGNQLTSTIQLGGGNIRAVTRTFDDANNLKTSTFYEGPQAGYGPDVGNVTRLDYYPDNTLHTVTDPLNRTMTFTYWDGPVPGLIKTYTDVLGNEFFFAYQGGLLQQATNPYGEKIVYQWDGVGRRTQTQYIAADGTVLMTTLATYYDDSQLKTWSVWIAGQPQAEPFLSQYQYDPNGNLTQMLNSQNVEIRLFYDPNNLVTEILYPLFQQMQRNISVAYDRDDYLQTQTYAATVHQDYVYDVLGRLMTFTDPLQYVYRYARTMLTGGPAPYLLRETLTWPELADTPGVLYTDTVTYDPIGRVVNLTDRSDNSTDLSYTITTDLPTETLQTAVLITLPPAAPGATRYTRLLVFDALGRLLSTTDQNTHTTQYAYSVETDPTSGTKVQVVTATDPLGNKEISRFDALNRLVGYSRGNPTANPPLVHNSTYEYDVLGRITSATESQDATSVATQFSYAYDQSSKTVLLTIGRPGTTAGSTLQYYDGAGQLTKQVDPFGTTTLREYAPWGMLASYQNGRGQLLAYLFDAAGRLHQVQQPDGSVLTHTLDANGNRQASQVGTNPDITRTFDAWNRLKTRTAPDTGSVGYQYWPTDQLKTLSYTDGKLVQYLIDGLQRLHTVTDWAQRVTTYGYLPTGQLSSVSFPNGAYTSYSYDTANRPTGYLHTAAGLVVASYSATLNALGQPQQANLILPLPPTFPSNGQIFTYNDGNQIVTADGVTQAYDADGEYIGQQGQPPLVEYDFYDHVTAINQLRQDRFSYDPDGLRTTAVLGDATRNYVFDVNGFQSAQVQRGDPTRALVAAEFSQALGGSIGTLPISRSSNKAVPLQRALDRVLEVRDATLNILDRYVHGLGLIAQEDNAGNYRVFQCDLVGNIIALTDANGTLLDRYNYDPFGQSLGQSGSSINPFRYGGWFGVLDDGNGFLYMRARTYSPQLMRFLQPDYFLGSPFRPQTLNRYAYVLGNPLQGVDPLGLDTLAIIVGVGLGALALGGAIYGLSQTGAFSSISAAVSGLFPRGGYTQLPTDYIEMQEFEASESSGAEGESQFSESESTTPEGSRPPVTEEGLFSLRSGQQVELGRGSTLTRRIVSTTSSEEAAINRVVNTLKTK